MRARMGWVGAIALGVVAVGPAGPAYAAGANLGTIGDVLIYDDSTDTTGNQLLVQPSTTDLVYNGSADLSVYAPCTAAGAKSATCPKASYPSGGAYFSMGSGNDLVLFAVDAAANTVVMHGGAGNDQLFDGDYIEAAGSSNHLFGEAGNDELDGDIMAGGSELVGGDGVDEAHLVRTATDLVTVSLDGVANDGPAGAQTSNVDVENLRLTGPASVTGSAGANEITMSGGGAATVNGGAGDDTITTGAGADVVDGGPGADHLTTREGNDTVMARDGNPDVIDCGDGADTAVVDATDTVSPSCEDVQLPVSRFSFGKAKDNKSKGTATLSVTLPGPGSVSLAGAKVKPQQASASGAGTMRLAVKPTSKTKRKLVGKGHAKVSVVVTFTPTFGTPRSQAMTVKLVLDRHH